MKKILVFGITDLPGGVESVIMNYYRNIDRTKIQFDFLCNTEKVAYEEEILGLGGTIYRITARSKDYKQYKSDMDKFFKEHSKEYLTIWVNVCSLANVDYLKYAKKYGIKYRIVHSHNSQNMDSLLRGMLHRWNRIFLSRYATDYWTCSEKSATWFYSSKKIKSNKYLVIRNAIDLEKYKFNGEIRKKYREEMKFDNKLVIGNIGRFHFQKNHPFIIKIFYELQKMHSDTILMLIGIGEDMEKIKNQVKSLELNDKVLFLNSRNDVQNLLQSMDVFLFPSLFEGLPVAMLEAQANGLPIFVSKEGIPSEAKIVENITSISLEKDPKYWAEKIIECNKNNNSNKNVEKLKKCGFDIQTEKEMIEKYFERE